MYYLIRVGQLAFEEKTLDVKFFEKMELGYLMPNHMVIRFIDLFHKRESWSPKL